MESQNKSTLKSTAQQATTFPYRTLSMLNLIPYQSHIHITHLHTNTMHIMQKKYIRRNRNNKIHAHNTSYTFIISEHFNLRVAGYQTRENREREKEHRWMPGSFISILKVLLELRGREGAMRETKPHHSGTALGRPRHLSTLQNPKNQLQDYPVDLIHMSIRALHTRTCIGATCFRTSSSPKNHPNTPRRFPKTP